MKNVKTGILLLMLGFIAMPMSAQHVQDLPRDGAFDRTHLNERRAMSYPHIREADVMWSKRVWREIDIREKMNLPFAYPRQPFIEVLFKGLQDGLITAYNPINDSFNLPLTYEEMRGSYEREDTIWVYNPETGMDEAYPIKETLDPSTITRFRVKEEWIFDRQRSTMVVRILGIAPVREVIDPNTYELRGMEYMFWVYYPDARDFLANHEAFNQFNDQLRLTWENVFEARLFSSYIVKESNVYDREIQDYADGIENVLESERIRNDIFRFEHELWDF